MTIAEMQGKSVVIKCVTKEEMWEITEYLHKYVPWAYREPFLKLSAFDDGYIFLFINPRGGYNNFRGEGLSSITNRMMAKDFLEANKRN